MCAPPSSSSPYCAVSAHPMPMGSQSIPCNFWSIVISTSFSIKQNVILIRSIHNKNNLLYRYRYKYSQYTVESCEYIDAMTRAASNFPIHGFTASTQRHNNSPYNRLICNRFQNLFSDIECETYERRCEAQTEVRNNHSQCNDGNGSIA